MSRRMRLARWLATVVIGVFVLTPFALAARAVPTQADRATSQQPLAMPDRIPLLFVPELVSPEGAASCAAREREASTRPSETGIPYRLGRATEANALKSTGSWVVALDLVGAAPRRPVGEGPLSTTMSDVKGPQEQWRTDLPSHRSVRYLEPWSGADTEVSGAAGGLASNFVVRPGADSGEITSPTAGRAWACSSRAARRSSAHQTGRSVSTRHLTTRKEQRARWDE